MADEMVQKSIISERRGSITKRENNILEQRDDITEQEINIPKKPCASAESQDSITVWLIRHGATAGNLEHRYIGTTDETLCEIGRRALQNCDYPLVDLVICSPMKRCLETAALLYPGIPVIKQTSLRECDFGRFEGKNYQDLTDDPEYQYWIDHNGMSPFPGGEDVHAFQKRCVEGFRHCMEELQESEYFGNAYEIEKQNSAKTSSNRSVAFVVHGGTVMSVLAAYGLPTGDYYDFQVKNGEGYQTVWDGSHLHIISSMGKVR